MTNKLAPYKNTSTMQLITKWWSEECPQNRYGYSDMPATMIDLYKSFIEFSAIEPFAAEFVDPNQFAKCLVAAKIADCGGFWSMLEKWEPKEYEIRRARFVGAA